MLILGLVLLSSFSVGVFIWAVLQHFLTADVPSALQHPTKFRFLHCIFLYVLTLVSLLSASVTGWGPFLSPCTLPLLSSPDSPEAVFAALSFASVVPFPSLFPSLPHSHPHFSSFKHQILLNANHWAAF